LKFIYVFFIALILKKLLLSITTIVHLIHKMRMINTLLKWPQHLTATTCPKQNAL